MNFKRFGKTANLFDLSTLTKYGVTSSFSIDGDKVTMLGSSGAGNYYYPNIVYDAGTYTFTFSANNNNSYFVMASNSDLNNAKINDVSLSANQSTIAANLGYGYARYIRPQSQNLTIYSDVSFIICFAPTIENYVVEDIELTTNSWHDTPHYIHNTSTDTITTPAVIYANDTTATVGLKGNMVQNGTPAPDNIIYPQECGDKTENIVNAYVEQGGWSSSDGTKPFKKGSSDEYYTIRLGSTDFIKLDSTKTYSVTVFPQSLLVAVTLCGSDKKRVSDTGWNNTNNQTITGADYIVFTIRNSTNTDISMSDFVGVMITEGSSIPTQYKPYGYEVPITVNNTTYSIYLNEPLRKIGDYADTINADGTVTRNIAKKVFDGTENFTYYNSAKVFWSDNSIKNMAGISTKSSHYVAIENRAASESRPLNTVCCYYGSYWHEMYFYNDYTTDVATFKQYLINQYSAGTPVTVWYVLATPTTEQITVPSISTTLGQNTLSVGTTLQPSEITVNYKGWHPVTDVHEYDSNFTIATMQALTIAQLQTYTISELQGGWI